MNSLQGGFLKHPITQLRSQGAGPGRTWPRPVPPNTASAGTVRRGESPWDPLQALTGDGQRKGPIREKRRGILVQGRRRERSRTRRLSKRCSGHQLAGAHWRSFLQPPLSALKADIETLAHPGATSATVPSDVCRSSPGLVLPTLRSFPFSNSYRDCAS